MSPDRTFMDRRLRRIALRLRGHNALAWAGRGFFTGAVAAVAAAAASRLIPVIPPLESTAALAACGVVAGFLWGFSRPVTLRGAAIRADLAAGTEEVISTAWEAPDDDFGTVNQSRAAALLRSLPSRRFRPGLALRAPLVPLVLVAAAAALLFVPTVKWGDASGDDPASLSALKIQKLERDAKKLKKLAEETENRELQKLQAEMKQLVQALKTGDMTKKEALARLAELSKEAESVRKDLEEKKKNLEALAKSPDAKSLAEAASRGDMGQAEKEAKQISDKLASGEMSAESKEALKSSLGEMAKSSDGKLSEAAAKAAEALDRGDGTALEKEMGGIAERLQGGKMGQSRSGESGSGESRPPGELDDALSDLGDAMDDLSGGDSLAEKSEFCPECGRRKPSDGMP